MKEKTMRIATGVMFALAGLILALSAIKPDSRSTTIWFSDIQTDGIQVFKVDAGPDGYSNLVQQVPGVGTEALTKAVAQAIRAGMLAEPRPQMIALK